MRISFAVSNPRCDGTAHERLAQPRTPNAPKREKAGFAERVTSIDETTGARGPQSSSSVLLGITSAE